MNKQRKTLFVPFAPSLAHVSRCLAVAEAWRARGHVAVFAVGPERTAMIQGAGFETRTLPEVPGQVFRADRGLRWLTREYFGQNIEAEQAILADVEPHVVVFDFRFTTALAARSAGLRSASILHGNALRLAFQPRKTAKLLVDSSQDVHGAAALRLRIQRRIFPFVFQAMQRRVARRLSPTLEANHLPPVDSPFELLHGNELLLADIPALLPSDVPPNCHIVGPLMWAGWDQPAPWLDELNAQPLVYVTMGSTVEAESGLVKITSALRDAPYNVVVSTGSLSLPPDLRLPPHIRVFPTVPGARVVQRSAAVVHHGGHETLMQALAAGVPSLIIPANPDQVLVAYQVAELGIGRSLWQPGALPVGTRILDEIAPDKIRREMDDLLADQNIRLACQVFRREIEASDGATAAADILEGVLRDVAN